MELGLRLELGLGLGLRAENRCEGPEHFRDGRGKLKACSRKRGRHGQDSNLARQVVMVIMIMRGGPKEVKQKERKIAKYSRDSEMDENKKIKHDVGSKAKANRIYNPV